MVPIKNILAFILSFIAGFVDTVGFIALSGIFTAHVTGNLVLAAASLNRTYPGISLYQLLLIPVFMISVAITSLIINHFIKKNRKPIKALLIIQGMLLFIFSISKTKYITGNSTFFITDNTIIAGSIGVLAMAMQNTYMRLVLKDLLPTTVMTGNLTVFSIELTNYIKSKLFKSSFETATLKKVSFVVFGFLFGSVLGALAVLKFGLICIALPSILLFLVPLFLKDE